MGATGGPSRRSHTKSRKGCITCKRRHIRCDELFPQCQNCSRHQVRCNYKDTRTATGDNAAPYTAQEDLQWREEHKRGAHMWAMTGNFPFSDMGPMPTDWASLSETERALLYHIGTTWATLFTAKIEGLTIWVHYVPKFFICAATSQHTLHALLAFSASHLDWLSPSEDRKLQVEEYVAQARAGVEQAQAMVDKSNSDSIIATLMLLSWMTTNVIEWNEVRTAIRTIVSKTHQWHHESAFADYIAFTAATDYGIAPDTRPPDRKALCHDVHEALMKMMPYKSTDTPPLNWIKELETFVDRIKTTSDNFTEMNQYEQLHPLRRWILWVPLLLLSTPVAANDDQVNSYLSIAHFYAVALSIEPLFPAVGSLFCATLSVAPLEWILQITSSLPKTARYGQHQTATAIFDFLGHATDQFRRRILTLNPHAQTSAFASSNRLAAIPINVNEQFGVFDPAALQHQSQFMGSPATATAGGVVQGMAQNPGASRSAYLQHPQEGGLDASNLYAPAPVRKMYTPLAAPTVTSPIMSGPDTHENMYQREMGSSSMPYLPPLQDGGVYNNAGAPNAPSYGGYPVNPGNQSQQPPPDARAQPRAPLQRLPDGRSQQVPPNHPPQQHVKQEAQPLQSHAQAQYAHPPQMQHPLSPMSLRYSPGSESMHPSMHQPHAAMQQHQAHPHFQYQSHQAYQQHPYQPASDPSGSSGIPQMSSPHHQTPQYHQHPYASADGYPNIPPPLEQTYSQQQPGIHQHPHAQTPVQR